jgi:orotidine-5'-phosphate decarboxylase
MNYKKKLKGIIKNKNSNLIIGLDTDIKKIPDVFLKFSDPLYEFNKFIIKSTSEIAAGYKFNIAFYEVMKDKGFELLRKSLKLIPDSCVKICDAKRGDIPNTCEMYAKIYFDDLNFDAITLSPYIGTDSVIPFLQRKNKFVYILALTSNKGSGDFQKLKTGGKYLFEIVIQKHLERFSSEKIGFVFGANHTMEINKVSKKFRNLSILIPGVGAQGNDLNILMKNIHNNLFLINSSRGIIYSGKIEEGINILKKKVVEKSLALRNIINSLKLSE